MPRRWLSIRSQKDSKDAVNLIQDQFDFEFVTNSQDLGPPSTPIKSITNMFNGASFRSKRKNDPWRPQSSSGNKPAVDKRLQLTKVEDSWIGVAFGSPTHPPSSLSDVSPIDNTKSAHIEIPTPSSPPLMAKYRKFSSLFRSRSGPLTISAPTNVYKIDGDQKIGMPIAQKPWQGPNSPPNWVNAENPEDYAMASLNISKSSEQHDISESNSTSRVALPKLEIQIPVIEMDRYSVMFNEVTEVKPSNLLQRRSRNLSHSRLASQNIIDQPHPPPTKPCPPPPSQRSTPSTHHRRTSSTYSLFPSPPKSTRNSEENLNGSLPCRQLSFSSSNQNTPEQIHSTPEQAQSMNDKRVTPVRHQSDSSFSSPDETVASSQLNDSPWRSRESLHSNVSSRTSICSEIFFDLKPAIDSEGREQSQYIIHKPDSPAVELALSKSRRARKAKQKKEVDDVRALISPDLQAAEHVLRVDERKWRLSLELNQAIAEVEKLTSPLNSFLQPTSTPEIMAMFPTVGPKELLPAPRLRKRLDGFSIGIPSPITERSEDFSPRELPRQPSRSPPRQHIASLSIRPAPLSTFNEAMGPRAEFAAITPPPVPVKDAKFIPMSRYAAAGCSVKLVEHKPKRRKPKRSATESHIDVKKLQAQNARRERERERPMTISSTTDRSNRMLLSPNTSKRVETGIVAVSVQPMAEVSVARTVSLARQQSHPVLLDGATSRMDDHSWLPTDQRMTLSPGRCKSPTFHEGRMGHRPGASVNLIVEGRSRR